MLEQKKINSSRMCFLIGSKYFAYLYVQPYHTRRSERKKKSYSFYTTNLLVHTRALSVYAAAVGPSWAMIISQREEYHNYIYREGDEMSVF